MKKYVVTLFVVLAGVGLTHAALINGGFEDPVASVEGENRIDLDTQADFMTGWTMIASAASNTVSLYSSNYDFWGALPATLTNGQYLGFNANEGPMGDAIEQTFSTAIGSTVSVRYDHGCASFGDLSAAVELKITSDGGELGDLLTQTNTHGTANGFTTYTAQFVATTTNTTLRFTDVSTGTTTSADMLLDGISVEQTALPPSPVTIMISGPVSGGTAVEISWTGLVSATYGVVTNADLGEAAGWASFVTNIPGMGTNVLTSVTNTISGDQTFYQVISE